MILYIFNNYFPDNSGFAKRCVMEIEALSQNEDVIILCKKNLTIESSTHKTAFKTLKIIRYGTNASLIERPHRYVTGIYEMVRNIKLIMALGGSLHGLLSRYKREKGDVSKIKIYSVCSPLTVPLIAYLVARLHGAVPEIVEFHDLEPELAKHIKKLSDNSFVTRIEYFLEQWMCRVYKKVIVTSQGQAEKIGERTKISSERIFVIPNTFTILNSGKKINKRTQYGIDDDDFLVCYSSTLYFDYTFKGVEKLIHKIPAIIKDIPRFKLMIIGGGEGVVYLKELVNKLSLENRVIFTGKIKEVFELLQRADTLIIPWEKDEMTETILPTKLFEYMQAKKPIIAPEFGEFKRVLVHNTDALLYKSVDELIGMIGDLNKNTYLRSKLGTNVYEKFKNLYAPQEQMRKLQKAINA